MLSRQFVHSSQSRIAARWFTRSSIAKESNQAPKNSNVLKDDVLGNDFTQNIYNIISKLRETHILYEITIPICDKYLRIYMINFN